MSEETISREEKELRRLVAHRLDEALKLGLHIEDAELVAASTVDLHDLGRLVDSGCDPAMALRILL